MLCMCSRLRFAFIIIFFFFFFMCSGIASNLLQREVGACARAPVRMPPALSFALKRPNVSFWLQAMLTKWEAARTKPGLVPPPPPTTPPTTTPASPPAAPLPRVQDPGPFPRRGLAVTAATSREQQPEQERQGAEIEGASLRHGPALFAGWAALAAQRQAWRWPGRCLQTWCSWW